MCDDYAGVFLEWADVGFAFGGLIIGALCGALAIVTSGIVR